MLFTVYKTTNLLNDKTYIGFHQVHSIKDILCTESTYSSIFSDGYLGSGKLLKQAIEKYGPENMKQELILVTADKEEAFALEKELVNRVFIERDDTYNLSIGGNVAILFGETSEERSAEKSKNTSKRFKGVPKTKESNEKRGKSISEWIQNNPEKHKERMNKINTDPDKIRKMTEKQTGKIWIMNIETKKNTRHDPALEIPLGCSRGFIKK